MDSVALKPSVLFGLEAAILSAASKLLKTSIARLLQEERASMEPAELIYVNGLLDCSGSPEEAAARAVELVKENGYRCLKVKVWPRSI